MTRPLYHAVVVGALAALVPSPALAHSAGVSQSDFTLQGRTVHAVVELARADAAPLLRGPDEASAARELVDAGIDVRADGDRCAPTFERAEGVGGDGYALRASFACPHPPRSLTVALPLLDELPPGHLHALRLASGPRVTDVALRSGAQVATLVLAPRRATPRVLFALGILAAGLLALLARRIVTRP